MIFPMGLDGWKKTKEFSNGLTKANSVFQQVKPKIKDDDEEYCWSVWADKIKMKFSKWQKKD